MTFQYSPLVITSELGRHADALVDRNSLSQGHRAPVCDRIEGIAVEDLVKTFGSPLFVFSERALRSAARRAGRLQLALSRHPVRLVIQDQLSPGDLQHLSRRRLDRRGGLRVRI